MSVDKIIRRYRNIAFFLFNRQFPSFRTFLQNDETIEERSNERDSGLSSDHYNDTSPSSGRSSSTSNSLSLLETAIFQEVNVQEIAPVNNIENGSSSTYNNYSPSQEIATHQANSNECQASSSTSDVPTTLTLSTENTKRALTAMHCVMCNSKIPKRYINIVRNTLNKEL